MASPLSNLAALQSMELRSSVSTRLNPNYFNRKTKRRDQLRKSVLEITDNVSQEEGSIKNRVGELETQLDVVKTQDKRKRINYNMQNTALGKRTQKLYQDLELLDQQLKRQDRISKQLSEETSTETSAKIQRFEASLRPLTEAAEIVTEEKKRVQSNLAELKDAIVLLADQYTELLESTQKDKQDIKVLELHKTTLDSTISGLMKQHPLEFNEIDTEIKTQKEINLLAESKLRQATELNEADRRIAEMERELEIAKQQLGKWEQQRQSGSGNSVQEAKLLKLEQQLMANCQELGVLPLAKAIEVAAKEQGIDLSSCIVKEQFRLIEDQQQILIEKAKVQAETIEKEISKLTETIEQQQTALRGKLCTDTVSEQQLMGLQQTTRRLRIDSEVAKRKHACNLSNIEKWKLKNKYSLRAPDNISWPTDSEIINECKGSAQNMLLKSERFSELESSLSRYIKLLTSRDGFTNPKSVIDIKATSEINQQNNYILMLESQLTSLQFERENIQNEFIKLVHSEKATRHKVETAKSEATRQREKLIAKQHKEIMQKKLLEHKRMHKVTDKQQLKRIEVAEYNKIKEDYEARKRQVRKQLEGHYGNLTYWDSQITAINDKLSSSKQLETNEGLQTMKSKETSNMLQLELLVESENELAAKYESMVEKKKQELARNYSKLIVNAGGIVDEDKLDEISTLRNNKEDEVIALESEAKALSQQHTKELSALEQQKRELLKRLNLQEREYELVQTKKNKATNLQRKLRDLEKEMRGIGVSLEDLRPESPERQSEDPLKSEDKPKVSSGNSQAASSSGSDSSDDSSVDSEEKLDKHPHDMVRTLKRDLFVSIPHRDRRNTIMSPIETSGGLKEPDEHLKTKFKFSEEDTAFQELCFFETILPLLEGAQLYKKFNNCKSLKNTEFDPLLADLEPIDSCGYGYRSLQLNKKLDRVEIRQQGKRNIETTIKIADMRGPTIPRHTMEIVKSQKKQWLVNSTDESPSYEQVYLEMKSSGIIVYEDPAFQSKSRKAKYYPFFIYMENSGRIEIVADDYIVFRQWVDGLNALMKNKNRLNRLRHKISVE